MKITILNGNPEASAFDRHLDGLQATLAAGGHSVTRLELRLLPLRHCIGCWGCWVKTPGECIARDASLEMDRAVINSDFTLWAAPLRMGFPAALLKMANDKHLPLIHPYMVVDQGEAHHLKRYRRYPRLGLLVEKEATTDDRDLQIVRDIYCRTALNFKGRLEFCLSTDTSPAGLADLITSPRPRSLPLPGRLGPLPGVRVTPPSSLVLLNGSPRGSRGNSPIFLREFARGFGGPAEMHHLIQVKQVAAHVEAFARAECAWLGFPLYTDAMPGVVKQFIEALAPLAGHSGNPPLGFIVQSGFPEGLHSRYLERYLEKLASRLGSPYLGTVIKGNGEGTRLMPPDMTRGLFADLQALGAGFAREGCLSPEILSRLASPERYPAWLGLVFRPLMRLPAFHSYFDAMLRKNSAYERRFARPFSD